MADGELCIGGERLNADAVASPWEGWQACGRKEDSQPFCARASCSAADHRRIAAARLVCSG